MLSLLKKAFKPTDLGPNAQKFLRYWHKVGGNAAGFDVASLQYQSIKALHPYMFSIVPDGSGGLHMRDVGEALQKRDELRLPDDFLQVFVRAEQQQVAARYDVCEDYTCGVAGTIARRPTGGRPVIFRSFLSLPILNDDRTLAYFINIDDDPKQRSLKYAGIELPYLSSGLTAVLEYEFLDIGHGAPE
ncbi:hypothetical protein GCM10017044_12720 [Kordiimonas sediminis]|uniref:Uncharacterized protein n=1 Tax=Kordiimonas sediminis TaxID=1735581 RepID=A0A919E707_9PROT|nr:hypothetical protein [Kordiimonas sediminis]GHF19508.1 hypothetical protein GCM10017044_12720 [Kordiimonas sediminis]